MADASATTAGTRMLKMLGDASQGIQKEHTMIPLLARRMGIQALPLPSNDTSAKAKQTLIDYIKANQKRH